MQFYLDGYKPGDPDILTAELPDAVGRPHRWQRSGWGLAGGHN